MTDYSEQSGCFPLCEGCWVMVGSPEARIEYYATLIDLWETNGSVDDATKIAIKRAVANEVHPAQPDPAAGEEGS